MFNCRSQRDQHFFAGLTHRQATDSVTIEIKIGSYLCALATQNGVNPTLHDAEQTLIGSRVRIACLFGPLRCSLKGKTNYFIRRWQWRADIQNHLYVGAQQLLSFYRRMRRKPMH